MTRSMAAAVGGVDGVGLKETFTLVFEMVAQSASTSHWQATGPIRTCWPGCGAKLKPAWQLASAD